MFLFGATYVDPSDGTPRRVLRKRMAKADLSHKVLALDSGADEPAVSRMLNGLAPLDLNRLWRASPGFLRKVLYDLLRAVIDREDREADARRDERKSA